MEIIKHGSPKNIADYERKNDTVAHFTCKRCGCEYTASLTKKELFISSHYDGPTGWLSRCPECGHTNEADMACSEEEGEAL